jgi:hypothetical protein
MKEERVFTCTKKCANMHFFLGKDSYLFLRTMCVGVPAIRLLITSEGLVLK